MLTDVHRAAIRRPGETIWEQPEERRLQRVFADLLRDAETEKKLPAEDAEALRRAFASRTAARQEAQDRFRLRRHDRHIHRSEAAELKALLDYRNDIAHRIHLVMSDISRNYWAIDHVAYAAPTYKARRWSGCAHTDARCGSVRAASSS